MTAFNMLKDENVVRGIVGGGVLGGVNNADEATSPEQGFTFPSVVDPKVSWLDGQCRVEAHLDNGWATHYPLPASGGVDSLGAAYIDDPNLDQNTNGVKLGSFGQFRNFQQRMAAPRYRFRLVGWAMRLGFQVPIPRLRMTSPKGVAVVPDDETPQRAFNAVVANWSGVPVFYAEWESWYVALIPPSDFLMPPINLAEHIRADVQLPANGETQVPTALPDSYAVPSQIPPLENPIRG